MASLVITVQGAGLAFRLARRPASRDARSATLATPLRRRRHRVLPAEHRARRHRDRAVDATSRSPRPGTTTSSGRAPSYFVGAGTAALASLARGARRLLGLRRSRSRRSTSTYRTYKVYMGRVEDEQRHVQQTSDLHLATIEALARAIDAKDADDRRCTSGACRSTPPAWRRRRASPITAIQGVKTAALLHDIGKLAVPEHILSKPGPLTQEEFQKIRIHPQVGAEIIAGGAVPVSGGAADPEPPRALGRQGLSAGPETARRSRSARAS